MGKRRLTKLSQKSIAALIVLTLLLVFYIYFSITGEQYESSLAKLLVLILILFFVGYSLQK